MLKKDDDKEQLVTKWSGNVNCHVYARIVLEELGLQVPSNAVLNGDNFRSMINAYIALKEAKEGVSTMTTGKIK